MDSNGKIAVRGKDGLRGTADLPPAEWGCDGQVLITLDGGGEVLVPSRMLLRNDDGTFFLPLAPEQLGQPLDRGRTVVIPIAQEELHVEKVPTATNKVVVHKTVREHEQVVDVPLLQESVELRRVPADRLLDAPLSVRQEGDVTIVPLMEEVLVVEKKLRLREEVHIIRHRSETHQPQTVRLRREEVQVERSAVPEGGP